jgi:hypothetical protein
MDTDATSEALRRLGAGEFTLTTVAAALEAALTLGAAEPADYRQVLDAVAAVHWLRAELAEAEPALIARARAAGASWQELAPVLGVSSRQAAERRYLRLRPTTDAGTGDDRVRAERDRRAGHRAVSRWTSTNTAHLRRLAGQITALTDLDAEASADIDRLLTALGDPDADALPHLLERAHRHLSGHPDLATQIAAITAQLETIREQTQEQRRTDRAAH